MKRISIVIALALALLVSAYSQTPQSGSIKKVQVTAQTIARQPAGEPYRIDLTRPGTIYEVAAGINYSRVLVSTSTGKMALSDLVRKPGLTGGSKFLLGTASDLRAVNFGFPPGGGTVQDPGGGPSQKITCDPATKPNGICTCKGFSECLQMVLDKVCAGELTCYPDHKCNCVQKT